jgi:hypothetical protein
MSTRQNSVFPPMKSSRNRSGERVSVARGRNEITPADLEAIEHVDEEI